MENNYPGLDGKPFEILIGANWVNKGDTFSMIYAKAVVIREPQTKWWHKLFFYLSCGLFTPKITYKVKLIK